MHPRASHPILTLEEARRLEAGLFHGDEAAEWAAMRRAGRAIGRAVLADYSELGPFPPEARLLVAVGKGHNGGDALLAAQTILENHADAVADVMLCFGERLLRPLAARAWRELVQAFPGRVRPVAAEALAENVYDVSLDGVFGFQFRPPLEPRMAEQFDALNRLAVSFRAAVDLPSGLGEPSVVKADFTYATGSVKTPVLEPAHGGAVGRLRYLDLGFFETPSGAAPMPPDAGLRVLTRQVLQPLRALRPAASDKRTYGHLFILAGSMRFPGAALMAAASAVRSGAGLVTAFVPEPLVPAFAARVPEAMWVGWPEAPEGGLALEGIHLLRERLERASALLLGPGAGREPETLALFEAVARLSPVPLVIDADALQPKIVGAGSARRILTPHAGEFARIAGDVDLASYGRRSGAVVVLKGPLTRVAGDGATYCSCAGGPVLARGGSGDLLAGLAGGLLAQAPAEPLAAACRAVAWQGRAADLWARASGQAAGAATGLLDHLPAALRGGDEP